MFESDLTLRDHHSNHGLHILQYLSLLRIVNVELPLQTYAMMRWPQNRHDWQLKFCLRQWLDWEMSVRVRQEDKVTIDGDKENILEERRWRQKALKIQ